MLRNTAGQTIQAMMRLSASDVHAIVPVTASLTISSYTNANPGVFTTSAVHNLVVGERVTISGCTSGMAACNGDWVVSAVGSTTTFSVAAWGTGTQLDTTSTGAKSGTPVVSPVPVHVFVTKDGGTPTLGTGTVSHIGRLSSGAAFTTSQVPLRSTITGTASNTTTSGATVLNDVSASTLGLWAYTPSQTETDAAAVSFTFIGAARISSAGSVAVNLYFEPQNTMIVSSGTTNTNTTTTVVFNDSVNTTSNYYVGSIVMFTSDNSKGQSRVVVASSNTSNITTLTVNRAFTSTPTASSKYIVISADALKTDSSLQATTTGGSAPTAAQIATAVWQDTTAGDFTVSGSIGKSLSPSVLGTAPGASGGILISGSNSGTTTFGALTVTGATTLTGAVTATNASNSISGVTASLSTAESRSVVSGTSNTNTTTTVVFNDSTNTASNYYQGMLVKFTSGNCNGQSRVVTSSSNTTNVTTLTVSRAFTTTPTASATYTVLSDDAAKVDSSSRVTADLDTIKTQSITCSAGVTVGAFVGNATAALSVDASGRVDIGKALGTAVTLDANNVLNVSAKYWAGTAITATSIPVATAAGSSGGLFIAGSNAATTVNITGNLTGNVSGSVGSVTGLTTATIATAVWTDTTAGDFTTSTSPGKIIFSQLGGAFTTTSSSVFSTAALANGPSGGSAPTAAQIATAVWTDTTASDFTTANSIGKSIMNGVSLGTGLTVANLTNAPTSGDLTAAMIASVTAACTASTPAATIGTLGADAITGTSLATSAITKIQANMATTANISALNNISTTDVKNQVIAALDTDTYTMPGAETPAETTTLRKMIQFLYKWLIRKKTQTSTFTSLYSADGNTVEQKAPVSDDGTTTTVGKIVTGP